MSYQEWIEREAELADRQLRIDMRDRHEIRSLTTCQNGLDAVELDTGERESRNAHLQKTTQA